jgi:large subunit ribosomal protein L22
MIITAEQKYKRETPTRLRLVANAVKKLAPKQAIIQLGFMNKKAAKTLLTVYKQAVANAVNNLGLSADGLVTKEIIIGEGPRYRRFQPVSRGRAHGIIKRTAHVRVVLESTEIAKPVKKKSDAKIVEGKTVAVEPAELTAPKSSMAKQDRKQMGRSQTTVKAVTVRKTGER